MTDRYAIFGRANATQDERRKDYRKAKKEMHLDLNPDKPEAEKWFKEVNQRITRWRIRKLIYSSSGLLSPMEVGAGPRLARS
jgi:DnaJ-domain-containing protein 1